MYNKEDFEDYINQILDIENKMKNIYEEIIPDISDEEIKSLLTIILQDEINHKNLLEEIKIIME
jgi:hypothetical protein